MILNVLELSIFDFLNSFLESKYNKMQSSYRLNIYGTQNTIDNNNAPSTQRVRGCPGCGGYSSCFC